MGNEESTEKRSTVDFVVGIGASGGQGLGDIKSLLASLPAGLPAVVMVVLHRPVNQISHLRTVLDVGSTLPVHVARDGEFLEAGHCYIGEPDAHLLLAANRFGNLIGDRDNVYRNRTIDALFCSIAKNAGDRFIGVVLSGALDDGSRGLAAIHAAGGTTMVLTPEPPPTRGMPENAAQFCGLIDFIGTPGEISAEITIKVLRTEQTERRKDTP